MRNAATLHMVCGKMASGKSTLAKHLANIEGAVLISEDEWLGALFADQMTTGADYVWFSAKLRDAMAPHVARLLNAGVTVVLDFPANTVETRAWMRALLEETDAKHRMHVMLTSDEACLDRLRARNAEGGHPFAPTEEMFHRFSRHFLPPTPDEGFEVIRHHSPA